MSSGTLTARQAADKLGHKFTSRIYALHAAGRLKGEKSDEHGLMLTEESINAYEAQKGARGTSKKEKKVKKAKAAKSAKKSTASRAQPKPSQKKKAEKAAQEAA